MSVGRYKLDGKIPVACQDSLEFARWFETADLTVQQEDVGQYFVSTVFLGIDHRFGEPGPPLLFESTVFTRVSVELMGADCAGVRLERELPGRCPLLRDHTTPMPRAWAREHVLEEICAAVYYMAAFEITWCEKKGRLHTERARRRWLRRHMIDRGKLWKMTGAH